MLVYLRISVELSAHVSECIGMHFVDVDMCKYSYSCTYLSKYHSTPRLLQSQWHAACEKTPHSPKQQPSVHIIYCYN